MAEEDLQILLDALQGKTADEIEQLIMSSSNAGAVTDSKTLAAYLVSMMS